MHPVKRLLIERNGMYCMLCGKKCKYHEIEWHHIKPKSITLKRENRIDNSYHNGSLLCIECHHYVHSFDYDSDKYQDLMWIIRTHKKP